SRTQHLQFHLLPLQQLKEHVRWVVADAKLVVSEEAIERVVQLGAGSVRDTLSALELVVASGGDVEQQIALDDLSSRSSTTTQVAHWPQSVRPCNLAPTLAP
ncbi:MAG: hypothetical protein ACKOEH_11335, partial [Actinomycetota bacterium]